MLSGKHRLSARAPPLCNSDASARPSTCNLAPCRGTFLAISGTDLQLLLYIVTSPHDYLPTHPPLVPTWVMTSLSFCLGVRSPCRMTASTQRSSSLGSPCQGEQAWLRGSVLCEQPGEGRTGASHVCTAQAQAQAWVSCCAHAPVLTSMHPSKGLCCMTSSDRRCVLECLRRRLLVLSHRPLTSSAYMSPSLSSGNSCRVTRVTNKQ
jgi:hypothetical protein